MILQSLSKRDHHHAARHDGRDMDPPLRFVYICMWHRVSAPSIPSAATSLVASFIARPPTMRLHLRLRDSLRAGDTRSNGIARGQRWAVLGSCKKRRVRARARVQE